MESSFSLVSIFQTLNLQSCRRAAVQVCQFLSEEDLEALCEGCPSLKTGNYFLSLLRNARFLNNFINRTDKSLYFTFFAEQQCRDIDIAQAAALAQEDSSFFIQQHSHWKAVTAMIGRCVPAVGEDMELLESLLADPELPLPKLKRETQGMYCSSPFQLFLVDCTFGQAQDEFFCFQGLREFLGVEREEAYVRQFMSLMKEKHGGSGPALRRVMQVRYTPYQVTATNFVDFLLEDNELHNFIVGLFALTDIMVQSTHVYISKIVDPLHRLVQLLLRYSIYRNFVLSVQQYLSFAFKIYDSVYHDSIEQDPRKPQFRFWRPALTKWFLKMDYLHQQGMQVYFHSLIRLRNRHLCNALKEFAREDEQKYGKLRNRTQLNAFQFGLGRKVYGQGMGAESQLALFFDEHPQNYEILVMQFNEYLIDVSVNEQTVHWCGHSLHQLERPYLEYEQSLLKLNEEYSTSLMCDLPADQKHQMVKIDVQYLSVLQIKNRTLKMILDNTNKSLDLSGENAVLFDFEEADKKLQFFNAKALILASVDEDERPFYSIPPLCSAEKLIDMLDTNDSSNNNSEQETFEYLSEEQTERNKKTPPQTNSKPSSKQPTKQQFQQQQDEQGQVQVKGKRPLLKKVFAQDMQCETLPSSVLQQWEV